MNITSTASEGCETFELTFSSLSENQRPYSFPCNRRGDVEIDSLTALQRINYLYARSLIGRDFARPQIRARVVH